MPPADNLDLVVDDHLLDEAAGIVGHAGVVAQDHFDFLAGDHVAVLLNIEPGARRGLPTRGVETGAGHGKAHADLDHLLRARIRCRECEQAGRGKSDRDVSTLHVIPPTSDLGAYPTSAIRIGRSDRSNRP